MSQVCNQSKIEPIADFKNICDKDEFSQVTTTSLTSHPMLLCHFSPQNKLFIFLRWRTSGTTCSSLSRGRDSWITSPPTSATRSSSSRFAWHFICIGILSNFRRHITHSELIKFVATSLRFHFRIEPWPISARSTLTLGANWRASWSITGSSPRSRSHTSKWEPGKPRNTLWGVND